MSHTQYYYLDFYRPLLALTPYNHPAYFSIPQPTTSIIRNPSSNSNNEQTFPPFSQTNMSIKIQQDQKRASQNCILSLNKKVHIISKKSKLKKINFIDKRNIIPNNINHILAFVQRKSKSEKLIEKIVIKQKKQQSYNVKGFYSYQAFVKNKLSVHVSTPALQMAVTHIDHEAQVFTPEQQLFYNRISRIAINYYLKNIAPVVTLHSQRLKNTSRQDHFKVQRFLQSVLESLSYQEVPSQEDEPKKH